MNFDDLKNMVDSYEESRLCTLKNAEFISLINDIKYTKEFIRDLDFLTFNKDFSLIGEWHIIQINHILTSAQNSLHSIQLCCEYCNLADAHTLIRKYRDDLFFYLYVIFVSTESNALEKDEVSKHEKNIIKWKEDNLQNLNINKILTYIGESNVAKEAVIKYKLQSSFKKISDDLNNFVHSNGKSFYNQSYRYYAENNLIKENTNKLKYEINYITSTFLFLLILIRGDYIASTDYIDYLDFGYTPEKGSEYWVASFVSKYINEKMILVNKEWKQYMKDVTNMDIK